MQTSTALLLGGAIGVLLGAVTVLAWRLSERDQGRASAVAEPLVPPGVAAVLSVLRSSALVVGPGDEVLKASAPAHMLGVVRGSQLNVSDLLEMVHLVRRDGQIREGELVLRRSRTGPALNVAARVAPLGSRLVLVLVEDRTRERRVDAIRRDFVANVSHELKTPVGALHLLAEAVGEASEDPEAVLRFAARMQTESDRLARLVQQIIELSRLQADDPLEDAAAVSVDEIVERAMDRVRVDSAGKLVDLRFAGQHGCVVIGNGDQILAALGNLVENAVVYSPPRTQVAITTRLVESMVDISVTDQGVGIPATELDRIFERFYRVDPARARATGGTGLGLSIVKHVAATHGGEVRVWSVEGEGSTFTMSLPAQLDEHGDPVVAGPRRTRPAAAVREPRGTPAPTGAARSRDAS
ncbi:MAG: two-component system, OmpR family, sensor histidine kinase SenX3 [Nocardioidaceae bacterium]|jgi:two-component system sensor histidine kinase SenX3|nr:two-component system, OmpR family, sensor histidine kinase SenX3 [Nocardioidaceae bacterium]